jgi:hypothetical protein
MYDSFFESWSNIPVGQSHEIRFEELEVDPIGQIRSCYEALALPDFELIKGRLQEYLAKNAGHEKVFHPEMLKEPLRSRIANSCERCFREWDYTT